jgi:AbrB family looped-hinge helix DNA binding protein
VKEFVSSVSPKGQITIPVEIREQLGLRPRDQVVIHLQGDEIKVRPGRLRLEDVAASIPALDRPMEIDEMIRIAQDEHARHVASEGASSQ